MDDCRVVLSKTRLISACSRPRSPPRCRNPLFAVCERPRDPGPRSIARAPKIALLPIALPHGYDPRPHDRMTHTTHRRRALRSQIAVVSLMRRGVAGIEDRGSAGRRRSN